MSRFSLPDVRRLIACVRDRGTRAVSREMNISPGKLHEAIVPSEPLAISAAERALDLDALPLSDRVLFAARRLGAAGAASMLRISADHLYATIIHPPDSVAPVALTVPPRRVARAAPRRVARASPPPPAILAALMSRSRKPATSSAKVTKPSHAKETPNMPTNTKKPTSAELGAVCPRAIAAALGLGENARVEAAIAAIEELRTGGLDEDAAMKAHGLSRREVKLAAELGKSYAWMRAAKKNIDARHGGGSR